jgi:hypothetical protein
MKRLTEAPNRVKYEGRGCFGLEFYATIEEARARAREVQRIGLTYNGGMFHGKPCGRETQFDHTDPETGQALFAVSI